MGKERKKQLNFEQKINKIQEIAEILNVGEQPFEQMLEIYEEGMQLIIECRNFLANAENKIIDIANSAD